MTTHDSEYNGKVYKLTNNQRRVFDYLMNGHTLTNLLALTALQVGSLSSRVAELRKMGINITTRVERDHQGRLFNKYDITDADGRRRA